ncbi:hypothetical protein ID866_9529 [Astraeus odoratus]|nr:hypothetical protein ID866_9529 [Astraeus odoratus]
MTTDTPWTPSSWTSKPAAQVREPSLQPRYRFPPNNPPADSRSNTPTSNTSIGLVDDLISIERLRYQLSAVQRNEAFLLHAGDCAESFDACTQQNISAKIGLILSFSLILIWGARLPVVRIGRIAGQYAKPRSSPTEKFGDKQVLSFRGDNVNGRTIGVDSGRESAPFERGGGRGVLGEVDFYTSHEGLMLNYEQAMTRSFPVPEEGTDAKPHDPESGFYNTSAHFLWVGDRTRQLNGAHVEYFRGIRNPIGIKVGPSLGKEELIELLQIVNPTKEPGRVTLITRYGASKVRDHLPGHIQAVRGSGHPVAWVCDPMHGNTLTSTNGLKTRNFGTIISELTSCISVHSECGSRLGGVSLEFTGELNDEGFSVTECLGGSMELSEDQLELRYQSFCDPRLNFEQSLDLAFLVSNYFKEERKGNTKANDTFKALLGSHTK